MSEQGTRKERRFLSFKDLPKDVQEEMCPNESHKRMVFRWAHVPEEDTMFSNSPIWSLYCIDQGFVPGERIFIDFN